MVDATPTVSITTLHLSTLNTPSKGQSLLDCTNIRSTTCWLQEINFKYDFDRVKVNELKNICHNKRNLEWLYQHKTK